VTGKPIFVKLMNTHNTVYSSFLCALVKRMTNQGKNGFQDVFEKLLGSIMSSKYYQVFY